MSGRSFLVPLIIIVNVGVFLSWNYLGWAEAVYMQANFLTSWVALEEGRYWTLITAVFSHKMLIHLLVNMFVLHSFGTLLAGVLGSRLFLMFYLSAGVISSVVHCLVSAFYIGGPGISALGASGAVAGLVLVFSLIFPKERILIFGLVPIPALWGALAFIALDLWGLSAQSQGGGLPIGHGAHLGGAFTGVLFYFFYLRRRVRRLRGGGSV